MTKVKPHQTFQLGEITTAVGMMGVEEPKELSSAVLNFPKDIPFQYDYEVDTFYVRPCYARYYEYITNKFAETGYTRKRGVTVTGTPGIGKSMFMAYFFLRYRFEHQHENPTIIMTSYNTSSILEEIVLWKDGLKSEEFYYDLPHLKKLYHEYPNALVLLDGPPAVAPRNQKYVAFTSPNESWFHRVRKDRSHKTIYMPLWDEEELTEAVDLLGLRDSLEPLDLGDDFPRFSNVMRYEKEELYRFDEAAMSINIWVNIAMVKHADAKEMYLEVYHDVPCDSLGKADLQLASEYVRILLFNRLQGLSEEKKQVLRSLPIVAGLGGLLLG